MLSALNTFAAMHQHKWQPDNPRVNLSPQQLHLSPFHEKLDSAYLCKSASSKSNKVTLTKRLKEPL